MSIKTQLTEDMKSAMKAREMDRLTTIRFLLSEIKNAEIDRGELDDTGIQKLIASQVKKIKDAIIEFEKADRQDLVAEETQKVILLEAYLPAQLSDEDLTKIVKETLATVGSDNQGLLIGAVMKKVAGQADGNRVSTAVRAALN